MLRLTSFGGVTLTRDGTPAAGAATVRRCLALLVALAAAGDRGVGRHALATLFGAQSHPEQTCHRSSRRRTPGGS
jgi:DNA-binding SARP family transcriptional activator